MTQSYRQHYLVAAALFGLYGVQVCPFLDSLSLGALLIPIMFSFALVGGGRFLFRHFVDKAELKYQVKRQFALDITLFLLTGLALAIYFRLLYQSPLESGLKVVIGMAILGFFIACDQALLRERKIAEQLASSGEHITPDCDPYPLTHKFSHFACICAVAVIGVVFMVISKDLHWLQQVGDKLPLATAQRYILTEVSFVVAVIMVYVLRIIFAYAGNLRMFIAMEQAALASVAKGDLQAEVPVSSNDEFGLMALHTNQTIAALAERSRELSITRDASILGLASLAETRDNETGGHILRTQNYVKALALELRKNKAYAAQLDDETVELLYKSAPLHDIGKVGIPDSILLKPGKLSDEEFEIMKGHPQIGADALEVAERQLGSNSFLRIAKEISLSHHEKWDGSGYPAGLAGNDIPLSGRLMALADVYDALISARVYKPAMSHDDAKAIILKGNGQHFDPGVIDAFLACEAEFVSIAQQFSDKKVEAA
ncbi:HD-GYP domain-containing protein [Pseudoteredinibacter isoporae]|uniref:Response regulator RpfG family c-di-GMP phosphodiesterase n=1 Tax=Pseudoteredinibacter isoporae TaxID=570281 RepID=A0A7X0MX69_9GAMM|nr:HD domain-containing phosphohydrolase [Pseudoteredinibacter isoporae]MBB6520577.1 response regulator RpfG family c-di-GMP phosphodiesterase [Pseudoteredinibacter isoporae]NHO86144.1 HD domain-containing protein [Pseudoteredinibacter isoporae]NIB25405.1 HD domain-containing protein [Pseudoteredinibacter isoporae]